MIHPKKFSLSYLILGILFLMIFSNSPLKVFADSRYPVRIVQQSNIIYPLDENTVSVVQIMIFENQGESKEEELSIFIPDGYSNLQLRGGIISENMDVTDQGIIDTSGLEAGKQKQVTISYDMPMKKEIAKWSIQTSLVVERMQIVIQPGVLSVSASDFIPQSDLFEMNGQEFRRFTKLDLHPDKIWPVSFKLITKENSKDLSPVPSNKITKDKVNKDGLKIIGQEGIGYGKVAVTVLVIIIAFSTALVGLKRDMEKTVRRKKLVNSTWLINERKSLLKEMAQLETDANAKLISNEIYEETKNKIRNRLIKITTEIKKRSIEL